MLKKFKELLKKIFINKYNVENYVYFINSSEFLPPPLSKEEEEYYFRQFKY